VTSYVSLLCQLEIKIYAHESKIESLLEQKGELEEELQSIQAAKQEVSVLCILSFALI
jgi:hypothetical protein